MSAPAVIYPRPLVVSRVCVTPVREIRTRPRISGSQQTLRWSKGDSNCRSPSRECRLIFAEQKGLQVDQSSQNRPSVFTGTNGSNPCTLQSGHWLVGIVDWPNRAGLPGVACESCVLSTSNGPAPRQVGRDGSPVGGCASSASTGIDARCGGPDVSDARGGPAWRKRLNGLSASTGRARAIRFA